VSHVGSYTVLSLVLEYRPAEETWTGNKSFRVCILLIQFIQLLSSSFSALSFRQQEQIWF